VNVEYYRQFVFEIMAETIPSVTNEQLEEVFKQLLLHREMEYEATGQIEADRSVIQIQKTEYAENAIRMFIRTIKDKILRPLDSSNPALFNAASHDQKMALGQLFNIEDLSPQL